MESKHTSSVITSWNYQQFTWHRDVGRLEHSKRGQYLFVMLDRVIYRWEILPLSLSHFHLRLFLTSFEIIRNCRFFMAPTHISLDFISDGYSDHQSSLMSCWDVIKGYTLPKVFLWIRFPTYRQNILDGRVQFTTKIILLFSKSSTYVISIYIPSSRWEDLL